MSRFSSFHAFRHSPPSHFLPRFNNIFSISALSTSDSEAPTRALAIRICKT